MKRLAVLLFVLATMSIGATSAARAQAEEPVRDPFYLAYGKKASVLTAGPEESVWFVADGERLVLGKVTPMGEVTEVKVGTRRPGEASIAYSTDTGDLWFGEAGAIGRRTATGLLRSYRLPRGASSPTALAIGPGGDLWFTEGAASRIGRLDSDGKLREFPLPPHRKPSDIVVGPDGALWFTERAANEIGRITTSGAISEFSVSGPPAKLDSIVAGTDGNLWFGEAAASRIGRITTTGAVSQFSVPTGQGTRGLVVGSDGRVYFLSGPEIAAIDTTGRVAWPACLGGCHTGTNALTLGPEGKLWVASGHVSCIGLSGGGAAIGLGDEPGFVTPYVLPPLTLGIGPHLTPLRGDLTSVLLACGSAAECGGTLHLGLYVVRDHKYVFRTLAMARYELSGGDARRVGFRLRAELGRFVHHGGHLHVLVRAEGDGQSRALRGFYLGD